MHVLCVGISHHTAPVAVREKLAAIGRDAAGLLRRLRAEYDHSEFALLSTCNRVEFYIARPLHGHPRVQQVARFIAEHSRLDPSELAPCLYHHDNEQAVSHLFRVASGLDSMVLGEHQIVTQIKQAYEQAQQVQTCGKTLHQVFQAALATSKQVRTTTGIGAGRLSVASAAVDFASHLFEDVRQKTVVTIGAGKMAELTLQHFMAQEPHQLHVANRSIAAAEELAARYGGQAHGLDALDDLLTAADIVISSTAAAEPIATARRVRQLVSARSLRPLFIIDIALPRDFEPAVANLANVYLYNLDDLQRVVAETQTLRNGEVDKARAVVEQAVATCYAQVQSEDFGDLVRELRRRMGDMAAAEAERAGNRLNGATPEDQQRIIEELAERLVNKMLHKPLSALGRGTAQQAALHAAALRRVFDLDAGEDLATPEHFEQGQSPSGDNSRP
jgi:glutamyl-tRNA reductase